MKLSSIIGIIVGIIIVVIGVVLAINYTGFLSTSTPTPPPSPTVSLPLPPPASPPTTSPTPPKTTIPSSPTPSVPVPTLKAGIWEFTITGVTGSGLTHTISAQITNASATDSSSVRAKIEVFSQGQRIPINGQDSLAEDLGTVKAKTSVTRQVTVTLTLIDALKVAQNGARFMLTVSSDKGTETLSYDYAP